MTRSVHLLVLIHGMWGNPGHLAELRRIIEEVKGGVHDVDEPVDGEEGGKVELEVLVAQNNAEESTYDGIDWGGERVADEVEARVKDIETGGGKVTRFSVTGYSLGGLLARYVIGILYQRHFFDTVQPVNFNTFATPHIGLLRYPSFFSTVFSSLGPKLLSRTGEQFFAVDKWGVIGKPLLEVMADRTQIFYQALLLFPHKTIYANAINDLTVPYATAGVDTHDPFVHRHRNGLEVEFDPKYEPIIKAYTIPKVPPPKPRKPKAFTKEWFRAMRPKDILPPQLQFKFPFNIVATLLIPILIPLFATLITVRLALSSRSSRARIRLLEGDEAKRSRTLVSMFATLERELEDVVVNVMDEAPGGEGGSRTPSGTSTPYSRAASPAQPSAPAAPQEKDKANGATTTETVVETNDRESKRSWCSKDSNSKAKLPKEQPLLSAAQREMVRALDALPGLRKELAYIDHVRNAHAAIVSRDVKRFAFHRRGEGVIRHWADGFVV